MSEARAGGARKLLLWLLGLAIVAFLAWKLHASHFDWAGFGRAWRAADWRLLLLGVAWIFCGHILRALRWAVFLGPAYGGSVRKAPSWTRLIGPQFIGFTALALFGRLGELVRPVVIARRTGLPVSSQIAVVAVERVFDLGAFALIFSLNLLLSPSLASLRHHEVFRKVGLAIAVLTAVLIGFVLAVRLAGSTVARLCGRLAGVIRASAAATVEEKVLEFRAGLNVVSGFGSFLLLALLSVAVWGTIAAAYVSTVRAFPAPAGLLNAADAVVLLGFSAVGSVVQLPGVGGGAQVGTIGALTVLFSIPQALAVPAGLMLYIVTTMAVIPAGLVFARLEGVSLRSTAKQRA